VPVILPVLIALIGVGVVSVFWQGSSLPGSIAWRARQTLRRRKAQLMKAPTAELVADARSAVRFERWERFPAGKTLVVEDIKDDAQLRVVINQLFAAVTEEDREKNRRGRDGNYFEFYDSGLALVLEVLEERMNERRKSS
jgi:hypothetical protein